MMLEKGGMIVQRVLSTILALAFVCILFRSTTSIDNHERIVADPCGPYEGIEGFPITFNATCTPGNGNKTLQYRWDFDNDGSWDTDWTYEPTSTYTWGDDYEGEIALQVMSLGDEKEDIKAEGYYYWFGPVNWMIERGQSFVPHQRIVTKIVVDVRVSWGSPNADIFLYVRESIDGPNLTEASLPPDELPTYPYPPPEDWPIFDFPDLELETGKVYYFVLTSPLTGGGNYEIHFSNDTYANGTAYIHDGPTEWEADIDRDVRFRTYTSEMILSEPGYTTVTVRNLNPTFEDFDYTVFENDPRTQGYWRFQCNHDDSPSPDHVGIQEDFIRRIEEESTVFGDLESKEDACVILQPPRPSTMEDMARQQLMALWLNVVSGKLHLNSSIELPKFAVTSELRDVIMEIEDTILNSSEREELERAKSISDDINNGIGVPVAFVVAEMTGSDMGSDDLVFTWDWGDGSSTSMVYYNNPPNPDAYPSPNVNPITVTDVQKHSFATGGHYRIKLTLEDDDGGIVVDSFDLTI